MKNIFDLIDTQTTQIDVAPQQKTKQQQQNQQIQLELPQTTTRRLLAEPKETLAVYDIVPQKKFATRLGTTKAFKDSIVDSFSSDNDLIGFFKQLRVVKHKKIKISKMRMRSVHDYEHYLFNPLEYVMLRFTQDPEKVANLARYLIASDPKFKTKKELDKAMYAWLQFSPSKARRIIRMGDEEFLKLYKLFIDLGASGEKYVHHLFDDLECETFMTENLDVIEMFLYENNPEINKKIFKAFYTCKYPEQLYPILEKYGFVPDIDRAILGTKYVTGPEVLKYLIKIGKIDKNELTDKKVQSVIFNYDVDGYVASSLVEDRVKEVLIWSEQAKPIKKITTKTPIKTTTKTSTETQQQIDQIFDEAMKSVEQQ